MSQNYEKEMEFYKNVFDAIPKYEIERNNKIQQMKIEQEVKNFSNSYNRNECYLCNNNFEYIDKSNPCLHWLLRRGNFRKKDFPKIYNKYGYYQITTFLRACLKRIVAYESSILVIVWNDILPQ